MLEGLLASVLSDAEARARSALDAKPFVNGAGLPAVAGLLGLRVGITDSVTLKLSMTS